MVKRFAVFRAYFLTLLAAIVVTASLPHAMAQQPPLPNAPSAPNSNTTAPTDTKDTKDDPAANPVDKTVGKSKLEQQTGTKNDRIFEVLPNYGTVRSNKNLPPLTVGQKFRIATASTFDWAVWPFNGALAAIAQAKNEPESWGQGWGAYGKRYGASFADNSIGTFMTTAIWPSMLHEDPRYYRMAEGPISHRIYYGLNRLFVTRTDSGATRFNYSESIGNAAAAAISNVYYPAEERTASRNATTFGFLILYDGLSNELKEFWPDIHRKLAHKKTTP
jgi:hypothetical protein